MVLALAADAADPLEGPVAATGAGLPVGAAAGPVFGGTGRATPRWPPRGSSGRDELATRNPRGHGAVPETEGETDRWRPRGPAAISAFATVEGLPPEKHLTRPWYPVRLWMDAVAGSLITRCAVAVGRDVRPSTMAYRSSRNLAKCHIAD